MWINELCKCNKVAIGMVHLDAFPGTPLYSGEGIDTIIEHAKHDYNNLVRGGIHAVIFCNENDKPYSKSVEPQIVSMMTAIIKEVVRDNKVVPYGVDIQWDCKAAIAVALATDATFVRGILCGTFCGDLGIFTPDTEAILKFRHVIGADHIKLLTNLSPEFSCTIDKRPKELVAKTVVKSSLADGLCVSGVMAGTSAQYEELTQVKEAVEGIPVLANTGVTTENVAEILKIADACVVATCLKVGHQSNERIDLKNVKLFMEQVNCA